MLIWMHKEHNSYSQFNTKLSVSPIPNEEL